MTNQPPPELFPSERPVSSDFATLPRKYRIRRAITCSILALLVFGAGFGIYAFTRGPTEIPTIMAEGPMKQKPEQPGGIDIPNQDVLAYQQIDNSAGKTPPVEHLLPPPETPQAPAPTPTATPATPPPFGQTIENLITPSPTLPVLTTVTQKPKASADEAPVPNAAPRSEVITADANAQAQPATPPSNEQQAAQPKEQPKEQKGASVTPASLPAVSAIHAVEPSALSRDEEKSTPQKSGKSSFRVQLASFPDIETARHQMTRMEKKFSSQLGDTKIHIAKADLGRRGIYYRLQSNPITDTEARDICKAITKLKGGCIVVKP